MVSSKPIKPLAADAKAALLQAVERLGSQVRVAKELRVTSPVISTLLKDKYLGDVKTMEQRIRGQFMAETVRCPVYGDLSKRSCLDNQALPQAFTNPQRAALSRACKTCPNRKDLS